MRPLLYLICILTDFAAFIVIFAVSRGLAEQQVPHWYLGVVGAGLSFTAGIASLSGGWLAHRFDGRKVFVTGAGLLVASILGCMAGPASRLYVPAYLLLGVGLGLIYPPMIGWLNRGDDVHANRRRVSQTLILFCVAWNFGMMCGQLTAGSLFSLGPHWTFGAALVIATVNVIIATAVAGTVSSHAPTGDAAPPPPPREAALATGFKRLSWIANLGGTFGGSLIVHLLPGLAVAIGIAPDDHGRLLGSWRAAVIATYLLLHFAGFWHFRFRFSVASQLLGVVGLLITASATSETTLFAGLVLLGQLVGFNYFSGLYYSTLGSSNENRSFAAGIHEATLATGMALGTIVGGTLGTVINQRAPYLFAAAVLTLLIGMQGVAWWRWIRPLRQDVSVPAPGAGATSHAPVASVPVMSESEIV